MYLIPIIATLLLVTITRLFEEMEKRIHKGHSNE